MTLDEQIKWVEGRIKNMRANSPRDIEAGRATQERVSYNLAVAQSTLETLTQLRGILKRGI